jgi:uncharacterized RmlC-like cupin family protein
MKQVFVNPLRSVLGVKAYDNYFSYRDRRGVLDVWFQPPLELLESMFNPVMSLQIQQATIVPGAARGHHYHPYEKAIDCFHLEAGKIALGFESINGEIQELYSFAPGTVVFFPPFVAHTAWNVGDTLLQFTTFKTWNYAIDPCVVKYQIEVSSEYLSELKESTFEMPSTGMFGFDTVSPVPKQEESACYLHY